MEQNEVGQKADSGKLRWGLLPWSALATVVAVLEHGAEQYSDDNWKFVLGAKARYLNAGFRHLIARAQGEMRDPDSGLPHLAHAVCCCLFVLWFDENKP